MQSLTWEVMGAGRQECPSSKLPSDAAGYRPLSENPSLQSLTLRFAGLSPERLQEALRKEDISRLLLQDRQELC